MKNIGYVRLSKDDVSSMSIDNQIKDLKKVDPDMEIFVDRGVSGEVNLTKADGAWTQLWQLFIADPVGVRICVVAFDRLGRKQGKVLSYVEDIIDLGGSIFVVRDNKTYDKTTDNIGQDVELMFQSFSNSQYRKEVARKTQRAIDELKAAGLKLGRRPALTDKQVREVKELADRGLGALSIGKVVRSKRADGSWVNTSPKVIRKVLAGDYQSREQWDAFNERQRARLLVGTDGFTVSGSVQKDA